MSGKQSVLSDEASNFRKVLEKPSPDSTSFRSELSSDVEGHKGHKQRTHRSSSHRRHRSHRDRDRATNDGRALDVRDLSRLLAHEEVESVEMHKVLARTSDRLDHETRRANDAEARVREAEARVIQMQIAQAKTQAELLRERETVKAYQAQLEAARNEILRAQKELDSMAADQEKIAEEAAKDRSNARALAREIEIHHALERGRQEGKTQGFLEGRKEGWYLGSREGRKQVWKEIEKELDEENTDNASVGSAPTPPYPGPENNAIGLSSMGSAAPPPPPAPADQNPVKSQVLPDASSQTIPQTTHKRTRSFSQRLRDPFRRHSESKSTSVLIDKARMGATTSVRSIPSSERLQDRSGSAQAAPSTSRDPGRISPVQFNLPSPRRSPVGFNPPSPRRRSPNPQEPPLTPRRSPAPQDSQRRSPVSHIPPPSPRPSQMSPLPSDFIPLQENGRVSLPPPHDIEPPPSPRSPALPLPLEISSSTLVGSNLQPPNGIVNAAPTITVQEPTPPEPIFVMPEPRPAIPSTENNVKPSQVLARDHAVGSRSESPPLPPIPGERGPKGKQRQRPVRGRGGGGLHAPGRSSPSDTSTEFSQFDMLSGATEPQDRGRFAMGRGNGSTLSVIMEGGSTAAESPEPKQRQPPMGDRQATPHMGPESAPNLMEGMPRPPSRQGILHDPREYEDIPEAQVSPSKLAHRQAVAGQLRWTPSEEDMETRRIRDDVSIKSSTSAPRRRPNVKMPERLGRSRDVEILEKQAALYDNFGTGRKYPSFEPLSSPDEVVSPRATPDPRSPSGHRRAKSSASSVPGITIQPPSRPSSHSSKLSGTNIGNNISSPPEAISMPVPNTPSRRHSLQGLPMTPANVSPSQPSGQLPTTLMAPNQGEFTLPAGFIPTGGPPQVMEEVSSMIPSPVPQIFAKSPRMSAGGPGGGSFLGHSPANIPLPMSAATSTWGLPHDGPPAPMENSQSLHIGVPDASTMTYEPARVPLGFQHSPSFGPAKVPLPESVAGSPRGSMTMRTPAGGWGPLGTGNTPASGWGALGTGNTPASGWGALGTGNTPASGWGALGTGNTPGPPMPASLGADRPMALYAGGSPNKKH